MAWLRFIPIVLLAASVSAAEPVAEPGDPSAASQPAQRGPWPTKRMIDLGLSRLTREMGKRYGLDPNQAGVLQQQLNTRWPAFLVAQRSTLQPLVNEFVEVTITGDPPTAEQVARWARASEPVLKAARVEFEGTQAAVRKVLRPDQVKRWDEDHTHFYKDMGSVETELGQLSRGRFDPTSWRPLWRKPSAESRLPTQPAVASGSSSPGEGAAMPSAPGAGRAAGPIRLGSDDATRAARPEALRQAAPALDAWESYVKQFIERHKLDPGQTSSALAILKDMKHQASRYRLTHRDEILRLERAVVEADPEARTTIQRQLNELLAPINQLFDELRSRLDALLTESQRKAAAQ
jgi:hypothetical protein